MEIESTDGEIKIAVKSGHRTNKRNRAVKDKRPLFIVAVMEEATLEKAAERCQVKLKLARQWISAKWFKEEFAALSGRIVDMHVKRLSVMYGDALNLLHRAVKEVHKSVTAPQVGAAKTIMESFRHEIKVAEQDANIEKLRERLRDISALLESRGIAAGGTTISVGNQEHLH